MAVVLAELSNNPLQFGTTGAAPNQLKAIGTQLTAYSPEIMKAAQTISFDLYEENAGKDAVVERMQGKI